MTAQEWTTLASVVVAALAVVVAGLSLRQASQARDITWTREALEGAFVDFLTASYNHRGACKHLAQLRLGQPSRRPEADWVESLVESAGVMLNSLSRIRLLTDLETVEIARRVQAHNNLDEQMVQVEQRYLDFQAGYAQRRAAYELDRDTFVAKAQRHLRRRW